MSEIRLDEATVEELRGLCVTIGGGRLALPAFDEICRRAARLAETQKALKELLDGLTVEFDYGSGQYLSLQARHETLDRARAALTTHHADGGAKPPPPDPRLVKRIEII